MPGRHHEFGPISLNWVLSSKRVANLSISDLPEPERIEISRTMRLLDSEGYEYPARPLFTQQREAYY